MNLEPIKQAVRQAALLCREVQHNSLRSVTKFNNDKSENEPVTIADYGSQAIICRAIKEHFPDDAIIAEEAGQQFLELTTDTLRAEVLNLLTTILDENVTQDDVVGWLDHGSGKTAQRVWVIDPIDGTKGFVDMRHYAIGVGIVEHGKPVGSVMAAPGYGDGISGNDEEGMLFYIENGVPYQEALWSESERKIIHVSDRTTNLRTVQSFEKLHASKDRMAIVREKAGMADASVNDLDSMEKYALVANGDADVYLRLPNLDSKRPHMAWDHAAGVALVLAAGGSATDFDGSPLDFSQGHILPNKGMLVSNGKVHAALVQATLELIAEESKV